MMRIEVKSVVFKTPWIRAKGPPHWIGTLGSVPRQRSRHPRLAGNVLRSRPVSSLSRRPQLTGDARRGRLAPRRPRHPVGPQRSPQKTGAQEANRYRVSSHPGTHHVKCFAECELATDSEDGVEDRPLFRRVFQQRPVRRTRTQWTRPKRTTLRSNRRHSSASPRSAPRQTHR